MAALQSISGEFGMKAKGSDAFKDVELDSANDAQYSNNTAPKIDLMQAAVKQVAEPDMQAANQPQNKKQVEAQQQFNSLLANQIDLGVAKDRSAGADAGNNRMKSAADAGKQFINKAAQLKETIAGADKQSSAPSFARAVAGQAVGLTAAVGVGMAAGPVAGNMTAVATTAHDVAAVFSGRSSGPSSFKTTDSKGRENTGYVAAAPEQSAAGAAPVSTAFMKNMSTGIDKGAVDLTSAGLNEISSAPKLDMKQLEKSVAWSGLAGVNRNGLEVARADGEKPEAKDQQLDLAVPKLPNPGVFTPPKPLMGLA